MQPLVSVIIPSFNRATQIDLTLDSILKQTYQNWECIVVDDGSTDNTVNVIEKCCQKDSRFKILKRERLPKGAPTCRNIGLDNAQGEYVVFLDSDDILLSNALYNRVGFLMKNPTLDFCVSNGLRGKYPIENKNEYKIISTYKSKEVLKEFINFTPPWVCLNPTYRRNSLLTNNIIWDENMKGYQDIDFHVQSVIKNLHFDYIKDEPDSIWTEHDNENIGRDMSKNGVHLKQKLYLLNKYRRFLDKAILNTLAINILKSYFGYELSAEIKKSTINVVRESCPWISKVDLFLVESYKSTIEKEITVLPRIINALMALRGIRETIEPSINTHFLKKTWLKP